MAIFNWKIVPFLAIVYIVSLIGKNELFIHMINNEDYLDMKALLFFLIT